MKLSKVLGMKKSGHKIKAPLALLGLVMSMVMIPMSAAHAGELTIVGQTSAHPRFFDFDQAGNIYTANLDSNTISKITPTGSTTSFATGVGSTPFRIAVDSLGNVYSANLGNNTVSKITPEGAIFNNFGFTGDGSDPRGIITDKAGNVYTTNYGNSTISKITPEGKSYSDFIKFPENTNPYSITIDQLDNLYVGTCGHRLVDALGDIPSNLINAVIKITPTGVITTVGTIGQCANDIVMDASGNIYTANSGQTFGNSVTKVTPTGDHTNYETNQGILKYGVAVDPLGNMYVSNYGSNNVSKITPSGQPSILFTSLSTASPRAIRFSSGYLYTTHTDGSVTKFPLTTTSSGSSPNSKVAAISPGDTGVVIPSTPALPATTLNFGGSVPESVTVVPVASNPATVSATPFTISGSTKIVDIQISGTFTGSATVCLDGAPTDHLYHFTGGAWVELASRSYGNGQVCGVTTSFSPFAAAPPVPVALVAAPVPVPDPVQQSKITAFSVATAIAGTPTPVEITGSFVEKISAIHINGVALASGTWTQTASSVAFTMPGKSAGTYQIQIYNGSAPVMKVQNFTFTAPIVVVAPTPAPTAKPKVTYIRCAKPGHGTRVAYGVNPTCPAGYVKK